MNDAFDAKDQQDKMITPDMQDPAASGTAGTAPNKQNNNFYGCQFIFNQQ